MSQGDASGISGQDIPALAQIGVIKNQDKDLQPVIIQCERKAKEHC
jgi:hypothetical protein